MDFKTQTGATGEYDDFAKRIGVRQLKVVLILFTFLQIGLFARFTVNNQPDAVVPFSLLYLATLTAFLRRDKLSGSQIFIFIFFIFATGSLVGFFLVGLASAGPYLFFVALVASGVIEEQRTRRILISCFIILTSIVFLLAIFRVRTPFPTQIEAHLTSPVNWALLGGVLTMCGIVLTNIVGDVRKALIEYQVRLRRGIINSLVSITRYRDNETGFHLERCSRYASLLLGEAKKQGIPAALRLSDSLLAEAVRLHDIGKVAIPDSILLKPGKLTVEEFAIMTTHTRIGAEIIRDFSRNSGIAHEDVLRLAEEIACSHHENWDGTGYPYGLAGEAIPFSARIMAIIDVYDALRSERPYKKALSHEEAVSIMAGSAVHKFDPALLALFLKRQMDFARIRQDLSDATVPTGPSSD